MSKSAAIRLLILLVLLSTGCSTITKAEQPAVFDSVVLNDANSVGQTFTAHFDGLNGTEIYLEPLEAGQGEIQFTLREAPQSEILAQTAVPITEISTPGFYRFLIPVQPDSNQQSYFLQLRTKGTGSFKVGSAPGDTYLNGALYQNGQADDQRQMAFQLSYNTSRLALGLGSEVLLWGWYLLVSAFLFVLPGWALLDLVFSSSTGKIYWGTKLAISTGISLALYPIIMVLTDFTGLHLGSFYAWLPPVIGLLILIWQRWKCLNQKSLRSWKIHPSWLDITFSAVILIIFIARFWIIRTVEIPLWGDSLQHAMITQLILDNHGLFTSWQPYAPYYSLTTHFGISAFSALFAWITGVDGTQATLWMGQIINGLAILTLFPLAEKISKGNRWTGIGAMIMGGLISTLPATYVNWGRFAQLAGQAVLPVALWLLWRAIENPQRSFRSEWPRLLLAGLALTGMVLSYYRMPFYFATFVIVLLLFWVFPKWRVNIKTWMRILFGLLSIGLVSIIIFIPWGIRLMGSTLVTTMEASITTGTSSIDIPTELEYFRHLTDYFPVASLMIAGLAVIWGCIRKNWMVFGLPVWFAQLIVYMIGSTINLPAANTLLGFAIQISTYIPISLLVGFLVGEIMYRLEGFHSHWILSGASLLIILSAGWLGWQQRLLLDLNHYQLVTPADRKAMQWIEKQIPGEVNFLVQSFEYVGTAAGSDAGWWIPLLTQRSSMLPPQYAQVNEISIPIDYTQQIVSLVKLIQDKSITAPESIAALCDWGITYIYHGQGQGQVGGPALFQPNELETEEDTFIRIYHQDRVSIFSVKPAACAQRP